MIPWISYIISTAVSSSLTLAASEETHNGFVGKSTLTIIFEILGIVVCLFLCAVFSGLNLGLLALDRINLKILYDLGNDTDRKRVRKIMRVRKNGFILFILIIFI
jgi:hypothetical protein